MQSEKAKCKVRNSGAGLEVGTANPLNQIQTRIFGRFNQQIQKIDAIGCNSLPKPGRGTFKPLQCARSQRLGDNDNFSINAEAA